LWIFRITRFSIYLYSKNTCRRSMELFTNIYN